MRQRDSSKPVHRGDYLNQILLWNKAQRLIVGSQRAHIQCLDHRSHQCKQHGFVLLGEAFQRAQHQLLLGPPTSSSRPITDRPTQRNLYLGLIEDRDCLKIAKWHIPCQIMDLGISKQNGTMLHHTASRHNWQLRHMSGSGFQGAMILCSSSNFWPPSDFPFLIA